MERIFWPTRCNPHSNPIIRLARGLHWAAVIWAAFVALLGLSYSGNGAGPVFAVAALVPLFAARGLRYIFAGE